MDAHRLQTDPAAKIARLVARIPYRETEAYRFGNATVDARGGRFNGWPLDEGRHVASAVRRDRSGSM